MGILPGDESYFLSLAQLGSVPKDHLFDQKERKARAEQDQFCQDLAAGRIKLPNSQQGSREPMKTKETRFEIAVTGKKGMISSVTAS